MDALGKYLNVEPDYLAGKYHRECEKVDIYRLQNEIEDYGMDDPELPEDFWDNDGDNK